MKDSVIISICRALLRALGFVLLRLNGLYLECFPSDRLSDRVSDIETNLRRGFDQSDRLSALLGSCKIVYLDIGARGGLNKFLSTYRDYMSLLLVEPDPKEAKELKKSGVTVIDQAIADTPGYKEFFITKKGGLSGFLKPAGSFLPYYKGKSDRFEIVQTLDVLATTIGEVSRTLDLEIDLLKVDTQGTELQVLKGLGEVRPLAIISESSFAELYCGQDLFFELGAYLRTLGYLPSELNFQYSPPPLDRKLRRNMFLTGLPVHGDVMFIPDWTTEKGLEIIKRNECGWASILMIYGLEDVLQYVVKNTPLNCAGAIQKALDIKPKKVRGLKVYERVSY